MPTFARDRLTHGLPVSGVVVIDSRLAIGRVIDDLLLIDEASEMVEWEGRILYLPL